MSSTTRDEGCIFKGFLFGEDGAVTVDYVYLTAIIIGLALVCVQIVLDGSLGIGGTIEGSLEMAEIGPIDFSGNQ